MIESRTLDVSHLPDWDVSSHAPLWWGQLMLAAIECSMFALLIAMYFYLRLSVDMWPPPGTQLPHLTMPTIALVPLALSCFGSWWASDGAKKDDRAAMIWGMVINLLLACVFLGLRFAEMETLNFNWATDVHGTIFWSILFLHTVDTAADLVFTAVLILIMVVGKDGPKQRIGVHVDSLVWYFLAGIWVPFYIVIYWGPRLVGAP